MFVTCTLLFVAELHLPLVICSDSPSLLWTGFCACVINGTVWGCLALD